MKINYTEHKGVDCVYQEENNNVIWKSYRAYNFFNKEIVLGCLLKMVKYYLM